MRPRMLIVVLASLALFGSVARGETIGHLLVAGGETDVDPMDHDLFLLALGRTGLLGTLFDEGDEDEPREFTVWAPNDRAFVRFARDNGYRGRYDEKAVWEHLRDNVSRGRLAQLMRYHVTEERITPLELYLRSTSRAPVPTLLGRPLTPSYFVLQDGARAQRDARLVFPMHLHATNGIVRLIDRVMLPADP